MKQGLADTWYVGDAQDFVTRVPAYPASAGWTLHYRLVPFVTGDAIELVSQPADDGEAHRVAVQSSVSEDWDAGDYSAFAWVENVLGERHTVDPDVDSDGESTSLLVRLLPDPREVTAYDGRSPAKVALDAMNAGLSQWGSAAFSQVKSYTIGTRQMEFREFKDQGDFMSHLALLEAKVAREVWAGKVAAGLPNPRYIGVRFGRA